MGQAGFVATIAEAIAESIGREGAAQLGRQEGHVAHRRGVKCQLQFRRDGRAGFFWRRKRTFVSVKVIHPLRIIWRPSLTASEHRTPE